MVRRTGTTREIQKWVKREYGFQPRIVGSLIAKNFGGFRSIIDAAMDTDRGSGNVRLRNARRFFEPSNISDCAKSRLFRTWPSHSS